MLVSSGIAAAATVERDRGGRIVAPPDHQAETRVLDNLLQSSGLSVQLDSLTAGIRAQFLRAHRRQSNQDRLTIDRIVSERFAPGTLYARIKTEFQRDLEPGRLQKMLAWYDSPLGKRITGQELAALIAAGGPEAVADLEQNPSARRVELIERLDAAGGASETTVDVTVAIVRSLTVAFQPGLPAVAGLTRDQLDKQIAQARNRTLEDMRRLCMVSMLFAYRGLSDDELDQYVQFVESAGRWWAERDERAGRDQRRGRCDRAFQSSRRRCLSSSAPPNRTAAGFERASRRRLEDDDVCRVDSQRDHAGCRRRP
jgi:hypothetical protein